MALPIGEASATTDTAKSIYHMAANLEPDSTPLKVADKAPVRDGWRKLAQAIAPDVVNHIQANLELPHLNETGSPVLQVGGETVRIEGALFR